MTAKKENKQKNKLELSELITEIREEQRISPFFPDNSIETFIRAGMADIDNVCGTHIDYDDDLQARALLKSYVWYSNHQRLAEFKEVYVSEYTTLQIKYY